MITDKKILGLLEAQLGFMPNEQTMRTLERNEHLADIRQSEPGAVEAAAEAVRELYEQIGQPLPRGEPPEMMNRTRKPRNLPLRVAAVSTLIAGEAARDEDVIAFRREVLRGKLLTEQAVESWIKNQDRTDGAPCRWLRLRLPASTGVEQVIGKLDARLRFKPPLTEVRLPWEISWSFIGYVVPGSNWARFIKISATGKLERLRLLSEALATRFSWRPVQATMFVLTGAAPVVTLTRFDYHLRQPAAASRITMTIDPTISPAEVAGRYEKARQGVLGGRYRNLSDKHLKLAIFMADRPDNETLKHSMSAWNRRFPAWKYTQETNFGRDAAKVRQRLLSPPLHPHPRRISE